MKQMEPQNNSTVHLVFPVPTKLSIWDKWLERGIFHNPYNHSGMATLKIRIIEDYYKGNKELWMDYHKELFENAKTSK